MNIAIIGSRNYNNYEFIEATLLNLFPKLDICIISGGAKGVDMLAEKFADNYNLKKTIFLPEWSRYKSKAGVIRNTEIINASEFVVAFWDGKSKGTKDTIDKALKKGLKVKLVNINQTTHATDSTLSNNAKLSIL